MRAFEEEKAKLRPLPDDRFPVEDGVEVVVQMMPYARFDGNDYSVPHTRVRRVVSVVASADAVRVLDGTEEIARHSPLLGQGEADRGPGAHEALIASHGKGGERGAGHAPAVRGRPAGTRAGCRTRRAGREHRRRRRAPRGVA